VREKKKKFYPQIQGVTTTPTRKKRESRGEEGREEGRRLTPATNLSMTTAATPRREHGSGGGDGFGKGREREGEGGVFGATWVAKRWPSS
jgi:hypothetical protein